MWQACYVNRYSLLQLQIPFIDKYIFFMVNVLKFRKIFSICFQTKRWKSGLVFTECMSE